MSELKLKHVSGWTENGWVHISDPSTLDIHPYVTVSARQGLFRCDLCGQNVTLTSESSKRRHFRHSANEANKNCPERTFSASSYRPNLKEHDLPLRIHLFKDGSIRFELGFLRLPEDWYSNLSVTITLKTPSSNRTIHTYTYNHSRFFINSTTYLDVGSIPTGSFELAIEGGSRNVLQYWPKTVLGIHENGSAFEKENGLLKPFNSNIVVNKPYYFLTCGRLSKYRTPSSITYQELATTAGAIPGQFWTLYSIKASLFDGETAEFFQRYSYRLVEKETEMRPLWPLYREGPFSILHNHESMYMYITGDGAIEYYPRTNSRPFSTSNGKVVWFHSLERQQIMSIGQYKTLAYSYYWKTELNQPAQAVTIDALSIDGEHILSGESHILPRSKTIIISSKYFGYAERWKHNQLENKLPMSPSSKTMIDDIGFGETIKVFVGLDCVWSISYIKESIEIFIDELEIVKQLNSNNRSLIAAPHALKRIAVDFNNYPAIQAWIRKAIKNNEISQQSYRQLQELYRKLIVNNQ